MLYMKIIIICCDGTWDKPGNKDRNTIVKTNVQKIYEAVLSQGEVRQAKYYGQGVGTGFSLRDHVSGGITGLGIDRNIMDAYKFLMWNYDPGDQIYLFGFSRGAYTVRSLAGLIRNCGILQPIFLHLVSEAYHLYRDRSSITHPESDLMVAFREKYGIDEVDTPIYFLGVWDTVGALGIPLKWAASLNRKYQFHDVKLSSQIRYAYHALSIDEQRAAFEPALWEIKPEIKKLTDPPVREQVWFPGVHANVGGGYADAGLSDVTLQWMMDKAAATGLAFNADYSKYIHPDSCGRLRNSGTSIYLFTRKINRSINTGTTIYIDPETGKKKIIPVDRNEHIHYTCFERMYNQREYKPSNLSEDVRARTSFDPVKDKWNPDWLKYIR